MLLVGTSPSQMESKRKREMHCTFYWIVNQARNKARLERRKRGAKRMGDHKRNTQEKKKG